jgi:hypothetical protein
LLTKESATADNQRRSFLMFNIGTTPVGRAVLRLRGAVSSAGSVAIAAYAVPSTTWVESAVTWATQPPVSGAPLATVAIPSTTAVWHEWDVSALVRSARAAGRTAVSIGLIAPAATSPYAVFDSRESNNDPELLVTGTAPPSTGDIVLWANDATVVSGAWRREADSTAAGGVRLRHPDAGTAKLTTALANPVHYTEFTFTASAGVPYHLWIRGKADGNAYVNDSVFVQFNGSVTAGGTPAFRIGTTTSTTYVLEECSGCAIRNWGWEDNGYGPAALGQDIYFATSGPQTIRIQTREDGLAFDQVVLSPGTYRTSAPGAVRNDAMIVPQR